MLIRPKPIPTRSLLTHIIKGSPITIILYFVSTDMQRVDIFLSGFDRINFLLNPVQKKMGMSDLIFLLSVFDLFQRKFDDKSGSFPFTGLNIELAFMPVHDN